MVLAVTLTVAGLVSQILGVGYVFAEVAAIRENEWGEPTPRHQLDRWLRSRPWLKRLCRTQPPPGISITGSNTSVFMTDLKRPEPVREHPDALEWLSRLESYVSAIDEDIRSLMLDVQNRHQDAIRAAKADAADMLSEHEQERRHQLRHSVRRQNRAAVLILLGLVLNVVGAILT